jgi:hypothetical protein
MPVLTPVTAGTGIWTFSDLKDEVRELLGHGSDVNLISDTRVGNWVNMAQRQIVRLNPGLRDTYIRDATSLTVATSTYSYALSGLVYDVAHIRSLFYSKATATIVYYRIKPYKGGSEKWNDEIYPGLLNGDTGDLDYYCRKGNSLELSSVPTATQNAAKLIIEYDRLPPIMTGEDESPVLVDFDLAIVYMSMAIALDSPVLDKAQQSEIMLAKANRYIAERKKGERQYENAGYIG